MTIRAVVALWVAGLAALSAQDAARPRFEAASIRPSRSAERITFVRQNTGGRFVAENITVQGLIQQAYRLFPFQIIGGPEWLAEDRFDIQAVAPGTTAAQQGALLQQLLADRFALRARREQREQAVYALVVARDDGRLGPNLQPYPGECTPPAGGRSPCTMRNGPNSTEAIGLPLSTIVTQAMGNVNRLVVDRTGLTGRFTFKYEWSTDLSAADVAAGRVSYATALQEQLGLRLESGRAPVEVLVIEHVERPTLN